MAAACGTVQVILQAVVLIYTVVIVLRMTSGARGLVSGGGPVNELGVRQMALGTQEVAKVIQRFVRQSSMVVVGRDPCDRVVADATVHTCVEVVRVLTGCEHTVVTR